MGTDGACGLLFCAAKRSGAFVLVDQISDAQSSKYAFGLLMTHIKPQLLSSLKRASYG
jgi:hypothetical protein